MEKALAAWLLLAVSPASMASPTEVIQVAVEQVVRVVEDSELARPAAAERRRMEIRRIAERLFDFPEMARRSLARHWTDRTSQEREEFVRLFAAILERSYFGKLENFSGERIVYTGEAVDGEYATVRSKVITSRKTEIPIEYRLHLVNSRWAVYDVLIEGVSFVSTYRAQFNRLIQTSSYEGLMDKMRSKEQELTTLDQSARKPY
jgi:phospholipid transport system substrate-binding protein